MDLENSLRTGGHVLKRVGSDTFNGAILGAVIAGSISFIFALRRISRGQPVYPRSRSEVDHA